MKIIRDLEGKVVCSIDEKTRTVEIVKRGIKTKVVLLEDGTVKFQSRYVKK